MSFSRLLLGWLLLLALERDSVVHLEPLTLEGLPLHYFPLPDPVHHLLYIPGPYRLVKGPCVHHLVYKLYRYHSVVVTYQLLDLHYLLSRSNIVHSDLLIIASAVEFVLVHLHLKDPSSNTLDGLARGEFQIRISTIECRKIVHVQLVLDISQVERILVQDESGKRAVREVNASNDILLLSVDLVEYVPAHQGVYLVA